MGEFHWQFILFYDSSRLCTFFRAGTVSLLDGFIPYNNVPDYLDSLNCIDALSVMEELEVRCGRKRD